MYPQSAHGRSLHSPVLSAPEVPSHTQLVCLLPRCSRKGSTGCFSDLCISSSVGEILYEVFLTRRSPSPVAYRTVLIQPLSPQAPGSLLALEAQRRPLLWRHSLVANALPCLLRDCVLGTLGLGVSHHWPVDEQFPA